MEAKLRQRESADRIEPATAKRKARIPIYGERQVSPAARTPRWWRDARRRRMLAAADLIAAGVASIVTTSAIATLWAVALLPAWVVLAKLLGLYDRDHRVIRHLTVDEAPVIITWAVAGGIGVSALLALTPDGSHSNLSTAEMVAVAALGCLLLRVFARWLWRRITPVEHCLVIGDGELAQDLHRKLYLFEDMHLSVEAEIDPGELRPALNGARSSRDIGTLLAGIDRVILATTSLPPETIGEFSGVCRQRQVKLSVLSPFRGRALPAERISQVADLPVLEYNTWDVSRSSAALKRCFDLIGGAIGTLVLLLILPFVAAAIKLDTRGSVFFTQFRAGRGGRPFRIVKFRTMHSGAEQALADLVSIDELEDPMFKLEDDPRRTRVGRFLRRFSLDELPQMLNVLRGQMSIVGPRPEQIELVDRYLPEQRFRLDVKPGVTGPMQVNGRGHLNFSERLSVELDYIENLSFGRDLRIIALTLPAILKRHGAY